MKAIAACVLGGISLLGGTGTLLGAFLGAFFLTQIDHRTGTVPPSRLVERLYRRPGAAPGVLVLDGRLRQALARHQRALKYSRFQPGNKGGNRLPAFPNAKSKEVA